MFACPFNYNSCGSSSSFIKISDLTKRNYKLNNTVTKSFKNESICYWQISVDSSLYNLSSKYFYINIQINSYSGLYVHLNNGTTILNANNHIQIDGFLGGTNFTYQAFNNTIYIIVAAYEAKPILDFSYQLINLTPKNNTQNNQTNTTTPPINITDQNITYSKPIQVQARTQYGVIVFMGLVIFGSIVFIIIELFNDKKTMLKPIEIQSQRDSKSTNRDDIHFSNRMFLKNGHSDFKDNFQTNSDLLKAADQEQQFNNLQEDAVNLQDSSLFYHGQDRNLTVIHDVSTNNIMLSNSDTLPTISAHKSYSKVHPMDMSIQHSEVISKTKTKDSDGLQSQRKEETKQPEPQSKDKAQEEKQSFWSRFKGNNNAKKPVDAIRRFSILDQNTGIMLPQSLQAPSNRLSNNDIQEIRRKSKFLSSVQTTKPTDSTDKTVKIFGQIE
eukprot:403343184